MDAFFLEDLAVGVFFLEDLVADADEAVGAAVGAPSVTEVVTEVVTEAVAAAVVAATAVSATVAEVFALEDMVTVKEGDNDLADAIRGSGSGNGDAAEVRYACCFVSSLRRFDASIEVGFQAIGKYNQSLRGLHVCNFGPSRHNFLVLIARRNTQEHFW